MHSAHNPSTIKRSKNNNYYFLTFSHTHQERITSLNWLRTFTPIPIKIQSYTE